MPPANLDQLIRQGKYPGMAPHENTVIRDWLIAHGAEYDSIEFQVRLGAGEVCLPDMPEYLRECWKLNTQKRADAVAIKGGRATVIEAKDRIPPGAAGQVLAYKMLWQRDHPDIPVERMLVIGHSVESDIGELFDAQGIDLEVYPRI